MIRNSIHPTHVTVDDIARLLEDRLAEIDRARVLTRICACRRCHKLFQDSAVDFGLLESGALLPEDERKDLIAAGMAVFRLPPGSGRARRRLFAGGVSRGVALVAALLVVAVGAWFSIRAIDRRPAVGPEILSPIEAAVGAFSTASEFVLPGGEAFEAVDIPVYRAIRGPQYGMPDEPLESAIDALHTRYEEGGESPDVAYWLVAGFLATHRIGTARVYIQDARRLFPKDSRLMVLDAVVSRADGDLDRSGRLLRSAQKLQPNDPVILLDLAVVLADQGKTAEAGELLLAVRDNHPDTPIAARATVLLEKLQ